MATIVSYPYVWSTCGNVDFFSPHLLNQHCHRSSGSDTVSGERKMKTEKKSPANDQLLCISALTNELPGRGWQEPERRLSRGCERPGPSLPRCDPCLPTHKEPRLPATNECQRESPSSRPPASLQSPACCKTVGVRRIPELLIIYIILISSLLDTLTCMGSLPLSLACSFSVK